MVFLLAVPAAALPVLLVVGVQTLRVRLETRRSYSVTTPNVVSLSAGRRRKGAHRAGDRRLQLVTRAG